MRRAILSAVALLAFCLPANAGPQEDFTELLVSSSRSSNPSVSFLQGLGKFGDTQLNRAQVRGGIAAAEAQGLAINPSLKGMLNNVSAMRISNGRDVKIRMTQKKTKVDLGGKGWAHLKREVKFRITDKGNKLSKFSGFKLSKSKNSMSVGPDSIVFTTRKDGMRVATIDLGWLAGKKVIELGKAPKTANLDEPEFEGLTSLVQTG